jgi:hypothetical protein
MPIAAQDRGCSSPASSREQDLENVNDLNKRYQIGIEKERIAGDKIGTCASVAPHMGQA